MGKHKIIKNDKGQIVPDKCPYCGGEIVVQIHGEPIYICKDCEHYFGVMPFNKKHIKEKIIIDAIDKGLQYALDINYRRTIRGNLMNEELYELEIPFKIIQDFEYIISTNLHEFNSKCFYSGYNFLYDKNTKSFLFLKENDKTKNIPIYLSLINDISNSFYASIENKVIDADNYKYININVNIFNYNKKQIYIALKHEFIHLIQMYKYERFNNLNSLKNTVSVENNEFNIKNFNLIQNLLYIMSPTELEAHINGYCLFIDNAEMSNELKTLIGNNTLPQTIAKKLIEQDDANKVSYLQDFNRIVKTLEEQLEYGNYITLIYIGYYLTKHHLIYSNISKQYILKFSHDKFNTKYENDATDVLEQIKYRYSKYKKKIWDVTYKKLHLYSYI